MTVKTYAIQISGSMDQLALDLLEGLKLTAVGNHDFLLTGQFIDQPALYGFLDRIHAAGLVLVSLRCLGGPGQDERPGEIHMPSA